ncbi:hypothetical protein AYO44_12045 [Planctomycetaceae bacterium SCGC AG-212-F19]|nr:hypothetical protein AYO44_12045 [Planctomycetaceae bacterium SCGC AG-212-F19]
MRQALRSSLHLFVVAVLCTVAVLFLRLVLADWLHDRVPLLLPLLVAVFLASWYGGFPAGLLATALGVLLGLAFAPTPETRTQTPSSYRVPLLVFILEGLAISFSFGAMHKARRRLVRKQLQLEEENKQRRRVEQELVDADRRKNDFLATLAHELRNPLAPIAYSLEIMQHAKDDPVAVATAQETVKRQVRQMVRLVDDLLDVSRITRNKVELRKETVELAKVLQSAVETSHPLLAAAGHVLTVTQPAEPIVLDADPIRLAQVFANLLNNAAKYMDRGGKIWLTVERGGREAIVTVRDTGIGIPADMLPRIFEMFAQVDGALERSQGGLGIGLCLVKWLTEMHGGRVEAQSDGPGQGSAFIVRLPLCADAKVLAPAPPSDRPAASGHRVLVVDDNADAVSSMQAMLASLGNEVRTASDGVGAVAAAATFLPDVVLLDLRMPQMNGYDAAREIRAQPWGKEMVLIAHTGWGQEEDRRRSQAAGFDYHLVKPVASDALEKLLSGLPSNRC